MLSRLKQKHLTGDENLPYDPLGVALGNKKISQKEYECGRQYEKYFTAIYGKPHAKTLNFNNIKIHIVDNHARDLQHKIILDVMDNVLTVFRKDIVNACVYHRFPKDYKNLQLGLRRLLNVDI